MKLACIANLCRFAAALCFCIALPLDGLFLAAFYLNVFDFDLFLFSSCSVSFCVESIYILFGRCCYIHSPVLRTATSTTHRLTILGIRSLLVEDLDLVMYMYIFEQHAR